MYLNNFLQSFPFFLKKIGLFSLERANKRKKNLILPLKFNKVEGLYPHNESIFQFIMHIKSVCRLFVFLTTLSFVACTSDEMVLTVGEGVMSDDHLAYYTEDFTIESKTKLAEYVSTNNTGVALCGSYLDDYIGEITTNTVFKISPNLQSSSLESLGLTQSAVFDSLVFVLYPNGYVYGDTTSTVRLNIHKVTEDYSLDTLQSLEDGYSSYTYLKKNNSETAYDPDILGTISYIPEDVDVGDSVYIHLPESLGQEWLDKIIDEDDNFVINSTESSTDSDDKFIENVLQGITVRSVSGNNAIVGFDMPTSTETDVSPGIVIRLHYHTTGPYTDYALDFQVYDADHQYNQISADFSQGLLEGIVAGGDGIPSTQTNNLTFVQSGLGLMTEIEIPTLQEMYVFGSNPTIIDMDLDFEAYPRSFTNNLSLPTALAIDLLKSNGNLNSTGLLDVSGSAVSVSNTYYSDYEATFSIPITTYGQDEQELLSATNPYHQTLLLSAKDGDDDVPNINRMVIGDGENSECEMTVKMYYTLFE